MSPDLVLLAVAVGGYFALLVAIGALASRGSARTPEEYFLAGRGLGTLVLFMALFGTNCTTFVLVGIPGQAWAHGVAVFGLNAAILALGIPLSFWAIGVPARRIARRIGALTPAELYARHLGSRALGLVLVAAFTLYTIPYMVQAVVGAGIALGEASGGALSKELAGLLVLVVALLYTGLGGMRATAWTNVFQGALFLGFMVLALFLLADALGGFAAAGERVRERDPALLVRGDGWLFGPRAWASWGMVISLTVIGFPHMFARLLAARDERALQSVCRLYPLALVLLWLPAVLIGFWGAGAFPELERPDAVFSRMCAEHLPRWLGVFALLAILAAVMSTLDAQLLTLSSMLVRDVRDPFRPAASSHAGDVRAGRWIAVLLAAVVYALALLWAEESVFDLSRRAFEGYVTLVPALFLGVRWPRFDARAAILSIVAGNAVLAASWVLGERFPDAGFLPVLWAFLAALAAGVVPPLLSRPRPGTR